jgi:hypothetical protein
MNTRSTIRAAVHTIAFAASLAAGGAALAQEATYDMPIPAVSATTRAQVQAELAQAKRDGSTRVWSTSYNHIAAAKSLRSRDEVRAEVIADHRNGSAAALSGEDSGSFALARQLRVAPVQGTLATLAVAR